MLRYNGVELGAGSHIVVFGSCKVGNFVVSSPALYGLRNRFPSAVIGFIGSDVTVELESAHPCIDWRMSWDDPHPDALMHMAQRICSMRAQHGLVSLAINLDGFNPVTQVLTSYLAPTYVAGSSLDCRRRKLFDWGNLPSQNFLCDSDWDSEAFAERYQEILKSNYIAELFAVMAGVSGYCEPAHIQLPYVSPGFAVPDVLIHCTTARAAKLWPFDYWKVVVDSLQSRAVTVGLVGSSPSNQQEAYNSGSSEEWLLANTDLVDLRGRTSLLQLAGACLEARAVISVDAGPLHIAAAMGCPTLAVVGNDNRGTGASPVRLWMPRSQNVQRTISTHTCTLCADARFGNDACLADEHACMLSVHPNQVIEWMCEILN